MEDYLNQREDCFQKYLKKMVYIINNFVAGKRIEKLCKKDKIFTYGSKDSDWSINKIQPHPTHNLVSMLIFGKKYFFKTKLQSRLQIENLVCAMAVARSYNLPIKKLLK